MMPDIVPLGIPEISDTTHTLPATAPDNSGHDSGELRDLHESRELSDPRVNPVSISLGDIRIDIGSGASDDMISGIIKAVRYA